MFLGFLGTAEYSGGFNEGNETICGCGGVRTRDMNLLHYPQTLWRSIDGGLGNKIRTEESSPSPGPPLEACTPAGWVYVVGEGEF